MFALAMGCGAAVSVAEAAAQPAGAAPAATNAIIAPAAATVGQTAAPSAGTVDVMSSAEQGQTHLSESFDWAMRRERIRGQRRDALADTTFPVQLRTMYMDRDKFDDSENEAWAIGGSAGLKTGYFRDILSLGGTVYTSQPLYGPEGRDGTLILAPEQEGYTVIGEVYGDLLITDDVHAYIGRKGWDTTAAPATT